jgi:hypothetical protein
MAKKLKAVAYQTFTPDETYLPVTMQQFESLTNEVLNAINKVSAPHFLSADYAAQVLMTAIHALDHKFGYVKKSELFESCINRISCHVTFAAVEHIRERLNASAAPIDPQTDNVVPIGETDQAAPA